MTDTGQLPGEGLPENAGVVEQQPGDPGPGAYTFLDPSEHPPEEDDLLLMPGAQGAWSDPSHALQQPVPALQAAGVAQAQRPAAPQVPEQYTPAPPIPPQLQVQVRGVGLPSASDRPVGEQNGRPVAPQTPMGPEFAAQADLGTPTSIPAPEVVPAPAFVTQAEPSAQAPSGPMDLGAPDSVAPLPGVQQPGQTASQGDAQTVHSGEAPEPAGDPSPVEQTGQHTPLTAAEPAPDAPTTSEPAAPVQPAPIASGMTPPTAPRPLHMGPPMPPDSSTGVVRSLADRGPAETPPHPLTVQNLTVGPPSMGPEYLDVPVLPEPQLGEIPPPAGEPWDPQPPQSQPSAAGPAETVAPEPEPEPAAESSAGEEPIIEAEPVAEVQAVVEVEPVVEPVPQAEQASAAVDQGPDAAPDGPGGPEASAQQPPQQSEPEQNAEASSAPQATEAAEAVAESAATGSVAVAPPEAVEEPETVTTTGAPVAPEAAVVPEAATVEAVAVEAVVVPEAAEPEANATVETVADDADVSATGEAAPTPEPLQPDAEPEPTPPQETAPQQETEPIQAEPIQAEPIQAESVQAEPIQAEPIQAEPVHPDPVQVEPAPAVAPAEEAAEAQETGPVAELAGEAAPDAAAEPVATAEPQQVPEAAPAEETTSAAEPVEPLTTLAAATAAPEAAPTPEAEPAAEPLAQTATDATAEPEPPAGSASDSKAQPEQTASSEPVAAAAQPVADGSAAGPDTAPVPSTEEPRNPPAPGYDDVEREAVLRVMRDRRDVRNGFRSDPIPHEVLIRVLEAAHTAPSVGHSQPWDFVVIRSAETRGAMHELAQRQRDTYAKSLPKGRAKQFKELKIEAILDTPVNIVVTADPTRGGRHTLGRHSQPQMAPYSSALAVENLWLAARAEGLGVGWVSFFDEREMVRTLGLPEHLEVVAYLCVGYVDEFPEEPELMQSGWSKRRPLSWVVHEETYGRRALPGEEPKNLLQETVTSIRPLDAKALGEAWERQKRMTKPAGALGMLEIISAQLSGLSRMCPPPIPEPAALAVFAGDHGVHAQGVTAWPQEVTGQMVANFLGGGAVCNAFANQVGAEVCVIDVGVASDLPTTPGLLPRKVRAGTADFTAGPALTREEVFAAIEVGIETARDLVAAGNKALITGEMGIANTTVSAALICVYTGLDPSEVTGRGTGINDEMHARKVDVVRRGLELHEPDPADPIGVLAAVGGLEHAALVGLILGGASLRIPVLLDGVSAGAAALLARAIAPEALAACIAGHRSAEPGHVAALNKLGLRPLVDLDLRLGEGTGALLALPLVQSAARAMHEVATFDSAGVTEK
ncbi:nicotinate-nucleotide--dimethylbenzimidazole phosphoribosyltransferase [Streptomyces albipurpureus]|uniref:Nicotinate-nucleotide--dimethylbenzimidazole phosphoribosyltransferase n=1 Tax=Streptomyces albipurpureus TaxID=2897419 RepID=A0ABT0UPC7_9ACTN|nr:nicotinate-nucleotide--dimethylbenzimidazole phosphoribosyltransferase [Streptomyces sp. CWNU-1]MCM2390462.1 nicotinate-nucleotide--dimethylbenzimidazole phosphoribosyltransferase [Streptomyces sp. CWNU-1]